jgi:acyl-CoA reductase-like NAD-dependent aldehyde dehydrogenase
VESLTAERETLALLLVWEIGKPWRLACADVDRALDGVRWYLGEIDRQLEGRSPLPGPVSNIASWNYPMSVQIHAELVQALAGNAVVAKTPSQGGFHTLTLAHALMRRAGLPVTLLSGVGAELGNALISAPEIGALAFVGGLSDGRFLDGQDTSAYVAPACVLAPPSNWSLHHAEPFGPLDSVVIVDTESELLAAMNASNGSLVASVASDDIDFAARVAEELQAFKVGVNKPRSRGDREEVFGGKGASWKGAFVGGDLLVQAVTEGAEGEQLFGNFPTYSLYPETV